MRDRREDEQADLLIERLRAGRPGAGPVPERVRRAADGAFAARDTGAPVAEVVDDSLGPPGGLRPAAVRGPRYLVLRGAGVEVHLEVTGHGGHRRIAGRVAPPVDGAVEVRTPFEAQEYAVDDGGGFTAGAVPRGPVRLLLRDGGRPRVASCWLAM